MISEVESNDTLATAQPINLGLDVGEHSFLSISGSLTVTTNGYPTGFGVAEENVSIPTATDTGLTAGETGAIRYTSVIDPVAPQSFGADIDYFKVGAETGQVITISSGDNTFGFDPLVIIYDANGNVVDFNDDDPRSRTLASFLEFVVPATGDYYVAIQAQDTVHFDPFDPDTVYSEYGNEFLDLVTTRIDLSYHDFDFYSFDLEAGQVFAAAIDGLGTDLQLYDPFGKLVEISNQNRSVSVSEGTLESAETSNDASLAAVALETGTYTLRVSGNSSTDYQLSAGAYFRDQVTVPLLDSSPFLINTETEISQTDAKVAAQADGTFAAIWKDTSEFFEVSAEFSIRFQGFDSENQKVGPEVVIFDVDDNLIQGDILLTGYPHLSKTSLTALSDGNYLFAYAVRYQDANEEGIFGRIIDSTGTIVSGQDFLLSPFERVGDIFEDISITALPDGGFLHAWGNGEEDGWTGQFFDGAGQTVGAAISLDSEAAGNPRITQLADGNVLLSQYVLTNAGRDIVLRGKVVDQDGQIVMADLNLSANDRYSSDSFKPYDVVTLSTGGVAVVWHDYSLPDLLVADFAIRIFDSDFSATDQPITVNAEAGWDSNETQILSLNDGGFAVFISQDNKSNDTGRLIASIYNYDGSQRGASIEIADSVADPNGRYFTRFSTESLADGKLLVAWTDISGELGDNSFGGTHAQIIDPGVGPGHYVGTDGNDILVARQFADIVEGLAGNDVLEGNEGAARDVYNAQVFRLYQTMLGRQPDDEGLEFWAAQLFDESLDVVSMAEGFESSTEFQTVYGPLDDTGFVTLLYNNVLNRDPDAGGLAFWLGQLTGGTSRAEVATGFSESNEFAGLTGDSNAFFLASDQPLELTDNVYRLYQATLDREPDMPGFLDWLDTLSTGTTLLQVAQDFVTSDEFQTQYGSLDDEAFITLLYNNVLDRDPDAGGLAFWLNEIANGATRAKVVLGFSDSEEFVAGTIETLNTWMRATDSSAGDVLFGGSDNDRMFGGFGSDSFVFDASLDGADFVGDLERWDTLVFNGFSYTSREDALAHITQVGEDAVFSDQGNTITFYNTTVAGLDHADMFKFDDTTLLS